MNEYKYKTEFDYDIEKHIKILVKFNKAGRIFSLVMLIGSILLMIGVIINTKLQVMGFNFVAIILILISIMLVSINSKRGYRVRLRNIHGNATIKFEYEFYDDYLTINRTGGDYESYAKLKYNAVVKTDLVDDTLGYAMTKEQGVIFLSGSNIKDVVEFINSKIVVKK